MKDLDPIDLRILAALQQDARKSNKELAEAAGVAQSTCLERIRRLEREGVLLGSHCIIEPRALGLQLQAILSVRLARRRRDSLAGLKSHLLALPEALNLFHTSAGFLLHVAVRDSDHLLSFTLELGDRAEVERVETTIVYEHVTSPLAPAG
jgi:DNA-binding Lrp family transcriptional regulator